MNLTHSIENTLIFTDLDGTLLDHTYYNFDEALPMLDFIKQHNIPLIIVTSKTKSEVILLQEKLGICMPFIIENGAGIFIPSGDGYEMLALGKQYKETREMFSRFAKQFAMHGFFDMSVQEVVNLTGLTQAQATLARQRDFSEPFVLEDENDVEQLKQYVQKEGFDIVKGGRFFHLITKGQDKSLAVQQVVNYYNTLHNKKYETIVLGDSENDLTMLNEASTAVVIPHTDKTYLKTQNSNTINAKYVGPTGWNAALKGCFYVQ